MKNSEKSIQLEDIEELETKIGKTLPNDYKKYMMNNNGGYTEEPFFIKDKSIYTIEEIFPIKYGNRNLYAVYHRIKEAMHDNLIPIGSDSFGNMFCISVGNDYGAIYFWDHEKAHREKEEATKKISNTFDDFTSSTVAEVENEE